MNRLIGGKRGVIFLAVGLGLGQAMLAAGSSWPVSATTDRFVAQRTSAPLDPELKLVVALFRHGIRAPLEDFNDPKKEHHSKDRWPTIDDWKVVSGGGWGDLTKQGFSRATTLGRYYASEYTLGLGANFKVFLWADIDKRTRDTAWALRDGFRLGGNSNVSVEMRPPWLGGADPLFHPFKANCGTPDVTKLKAIADDINFYYKGWLAVHAEQANQLWNVLQCRDATRSADKCLPLFEVADHATAWSYSAERCSPVEWKGQFSYSSSASEAFLLEYANGMAAGEVGWGRVYPPNAGPSRLRDMLQLHEFYFDKTERQSTGPNPYYLAKIQGSNLIREILDQIKRKLNQPTDGQCPRADAQSQFVGLVGHDTNLASVGSLLNLTWRFDDPRLPDDTRNLPDNDALPAGALVFELRLRNGAYLVRVEYVTYSLQQMRSGSEKDLEKAFRLRVKGGDCASSDGPCEIPLEKFKQRVVGAIDKDFLSSCSESRQQICIPTSPAGHPSRNRGSRPPRGVGESFAGSKNLAQEVER